MFTVIFLCFATASFNNTVGLTNSIYSVKKIDYLILVWFISGALAAALIRCQAY